MASKQLPIVGEAFLGSDPLVQKMVRVTFGSSGFSGVNDVNVSTAGGQDLLTFADSNFMITNIIFNVVEAFSVAAIQVGADTSAVLFGADTTAAQTESNWAAVGAWDIRDAMSTSAVTGLASTDFAVLAGAWPADSDDSIVVSYSGAATLGTEGHCEMYVFYIETADQP